MGDPARETTNTPLAIEGLEHVFESWEQGSAPGEAQMSESQASPEPGSATGLAQGIPVDQAAKRLGISTNAVLKRLRKGKLHGFKVLGQFGEQWLVDLTDVVVPVHVELAPEPGLAAGEAQMSESQASPEPGSATGPATPDREHDLLKLVVQLSRENGALQALLNEREQQIKLLTDSQQNRSRWQRFWSWFTGR